jgi:iron complex transport system ATP-binding protein
VSGVLQVENISCGYRPDSPVLKDFSFEVKLGEFIGIVGPNGCGKTTLLRALSGLLPIKEGRVWLKDVEIRHMNRKDLSQKVAFIPQLMEPVPGFSVHDMVMMGRNPYLQRFNFETDEDYEIARWAIDELKIAALEHLPVTQLSGGEFQRVAVARALAQQPKLLLLDEPISHLDLRFQIRIMRLLRKIRKTRTIVATFHDLSLASKFCNKLLLIHKGEMVAFGYPDEVLTQENIWKAFRVKAQVKHDPRTKRARLVQLV